MLMAPVPFTLDNARGLCVCAFIGGIVRREYIAIAMRNKAAQVCWIFFAARLSGSLLSGNQALSSYTGEMGGNAFGVS